MDLDAIIKQAVDEYFDGVKFEWRKHCFDKQVDFITDPRRLKALFSTRRAAKSYTGGMYMVKEALEHDAVNCLYLGLTRQSAKAIIWKDVLKDINKRHSVGMEFNGTELTATMPNGSIIYVSGVDADEDEKEKLLGRKYKLVFLDEAASYSIDLRELVYGILKPATVDQGGSICLAGTSGNLTKGLFYDVTTNSEPGWSLHSWSAHDNPFIAKQWQEELDDIKANRPLFMETPLFKQWYLNQWVIDDDALVYRFSASRNEFSNLPIITTGEWEYVLGVDLGYDPDPSAFVVAAYHQHDSTLYILDCFKKTEMDITDVANHIKNYQKNYPIHKVVIDGANKQAVQEIQRRHGISLTTADKTGKSDFIQIMNAELIQGKIKLAPTTTQLKEEYAQLIWDEKDLERSGKREENPICANHLADAALYAWRFCYQFLSQPAKSKVDLRDKQQYVEHTKALMEEQLEKQIKQQQEAEETADMWNLSNMDLDDNPLSYYLNKRRGA